MTFDDREGRRPDDADRKQLAPAFVVTRQAGRVQEEREEDGGVPTGRYRTTFTTIPVFGPNDTVDDGDDFSARHPRICMKGRADGVIELKNQVDTVLAVQSFRVERRAGPNWVNVPLQGRQNKKLERGWSYGILDVRLDAVGKTFYEISPGVGTFRLVITTAPGRGQAPPVISTRKDGGTPHSARLNGLDLSFRDMAADIDTLEEVRGNLVLTTVGVALGNGESKTFDPSFTDNADWGADIDGSSKFPNDGSDWCGDSGNVDYRVANKFDISSLPAANTVDQVDLEIDVAVSGSASETWRIGPYNGDGQGDPETDAGSTAYSRCDVSADNYLTGITDFRSTGTKTFTDLGAQANSDVEAARDAGTIFSLAFEAESSVNNGLCEFDEYTASSNPPKLTVTHSAAGGGGAVPVFAHHYKMHRGQ